jgi:hypothetical protein
MTMKTTTMTKNLTILVLLSAAACSGKNKNNAEEGGGSVDPNATTGDTTDRSGEQVDPVKMDEVINLLDRKRGIVSRCLSMAIENGSAPKGSRGKITFAISIAPTGHTTSVEVVKTSIESKEVQGCVKRKIEEISFPPFSKQYDTSYTYAMEAN